MRRKAYGTYFIAKICQVTSPTVGRWIEQGKLPHFTTGGGQRRVWDADLVAFLKAHNIPVPWELLGIGKIRILIVDDESAIRRVLCRSLTKEFPEAEIYEAGDGFEAGHKTASLDPCLIILDIRLPGMDGYKVCQSIRQDSKSKRVKILAISGHDVEESKKRALAAGADDFVGKPFNLEELTQKLKKLLSVRNG